MSPSLTAPVAAPSTDWGWAVAMHAESPISASPLGLSLPSSPQRRQPPQPQALQHSQALVAHDAGPDVGRPSAPARASVGARGCQWQPAAIRARTCRQPGDLSGCNAVALGPRTQNTIAQADSTHLAHYPCEVQLAARGMLPPWLLARDSYANAQSKAAICFEVQYGCVQIACKQAIVSGRLLCAAKLLGFWRDVAVAARYAAFKPARPSSEAW